jgi:hypothetical protein
MAPPCHRKAAASSQSPAADTSAGSLALGGNCAEDMKFRDIIVCREERFSRGVEEESGRFYVAIPVSNAQVDYEEYYEIDARTFERFRHDLAEAQEFVARCRSREMDSLLIVQPGGGRGAPS